MGLLNAFVAGFGLSMDAFAVSISKGLTQKKINIINMLVIALFFGFFQFAMPIIGYLCCKPFSNYIESFDHWIAFVLLVFLGSKMIYECLKEDKVFKLKDNKNKTLEDSSLLHKGNTEITQLEDNKLQANSLDPESIDNNKNTITQNYKVNANNEVCIKCIKQNINRNVVLEGNNDTNILLNDSVKNINNSKTSLNNEYNNSNENLDIAKSSDRQNKKLTLDIKELIILAFATSIDALITGITFAFNGGNIFISASIIGIITFVLCCIGFLIGNYFGSKFKKVAEILGGVVLILLGIKFLLEGYNIIDLGF